MAQPQAGSSRPAKRPKLNCPDFDAGTIQSDLKEFRSQASVSMKVDDFRRRMLRIQSLEEEDPSISSPVYKIEYRTRPDGEIKIWKVKLVLTMPPKKDGESGVGVRLEFVDMYLAQLTIELKLSIDAVVGGPFRAKIGFKTDYWDEIGYDNFLNVAGIPDKKAVMVRADICILSTYLELENAPARALKCQGFNPFEKDLTDPKVISKFSDFTVISRQNVLIPFFRIIMISRSPVFKAMLDNQESKESQSREVIISDYGTVTLRIFLNFLVTDNITIGTNIRQAVRDTDETCDGDIVRNLLLLADKYEVKSLLEEAQQWLEKKLDGSNFMNTLRVACLVNHKELVKTCIKHMMGKMNGKKPSMADLRSCGLDQEILDKLCESLM